MTYSKEALGQPSTTLVLCGGRGERMGEAYRDQQKVLLDVGGITLLEQVVRGVVKEADGSAAQRKVALLTGHGANAVEKEVDRWPSWLSGNVASIEEYHAGENSLAGLISHLPNPRTMVSGNVLLDYPAILGQVEGLLRDDPQRPVVVGSPILRTSTHYAIEVEGADVTALTRRAATPADREVVDVFGLTDEVIDLADQAGRGCATALARHVTDLRPQYIEYDGGWAHFEVPQDFENYLGGLYGNFDNR